jgi:ribonuclease P protein component
MTPPETELIDDIVDRPGPAVSSCQPLTVLTQRRDFQRAARGKRVAMDGFVLQMLKRPEGDNANVRIGFTCSKKVGNAVARNRAKRRLREIARAVLTVSGKPGHDYVLIGRNTTTAALPFTQLLNNLERAVSILHGARK